MKKIVLYYQIVKAEYDSLLSSPARKKLLVIKHDNRL